MKIIRSCVESSALMVNTSLGQCLQFQGNTYVYCFYNGKTSNQQNRLIFQLPNHVDVFRHNKDNERIILGIQKDIHSLRFPQPTEYASKLV